jgi:hypothetical protein
MILPDTGPAPSAPLLPEPGTLVLLNRPLRPGTDPSTLSVFADQRWRLSPAVFEGHTTAFSIDFSPITAPFLHTVKTLTWLLLNHTSAGVSTFYFRPRTLAITTITSTFRNLRLFTDWLHGRGRTCFGEVSLADLDDYAAHVKATETSHAQREDRLSIVNRVWSYRDLLPEADRLPQTPPWRGERIQDILQQRRAAIREENRTPRIHPETMSALLAWALRFVETFAEDITAAFGEHLVLSERSGRSRGGRDIPPPRRPKGALTDELRVLLSDYRERGRPLPGLRDSDGTLRVNLSHLGKVLDTARGALDNSSNRAVFAEMALPVIEGAPLDAPVIGRLDGRPWHDGAIDYSDAGFLARHLSTACFVLNVAASNEITPTAWSSCEADTGKVSATLPATRCPRARSGPIRGSSPRPSPPPSPSWNGCTRAPGCSRRRCSPTAATARPSCAAASAAPGRRPGSTTTSPNSWPGSRPTAPNTAAAITSRPTRSTRSSTPLACAALWPGSSSAGRGVWLPPPSSTDISASR